MYEFSVVIPVYNSAPMLEELYQRIADVFDNQLKRSFELIFVDDSSTDQSSNKIKRLNYLDKRVKYIQLARNYGQHKALLCGFKYAKGDYIITMDDDLQHPPEEITKLVNKMTENEDIDVVIGRYLKKHHNSIRNFGTYITNRITSFVFHKDVNLKLTSFRLMKKYVAKQMIDIDVINPRIGHLLLLVTNHISNVDVIHEERKQGKSGYKFSMLVKDFINNIINNSDIPLRFVSILGIFSFCLSLALIVFYIFKYILYGILVQGWMTIILLLLSFFGITLFSIGVIGKYLLNILKQTKKTPLYVVRNYIIDEEDAL